MVLSSNGRLLAFPANIERNSNGKHSILLRQLGHKKVYSIGPCTEGSHNRAGTAKKFYSIESCIETLQTELLIYLLVGNYSASVVNLINSKSS